MVLDCLFQSLRPKGNRVLITQFPSLTLGNPQIGSGCVPGSSPKIMANSGIPVVFAGGERDVQRGRTGSSHYLKQSSLLRYRCMALYLDQQNTCRALDEVVTVAEWGPFLVGTRRATKPTAFTESFKLA